MLFWRSRSSLMKVTTVTLLVALLVDVFTIASPHWTISTELTDIGLWSYMQPNATYPDKAIPLLYPSLAVASLSMLFLDNCINLCCLFACPFITLPLLILFTILALCIQTTLMLVWSHLHISRHYHFRLTYYLAGVVDLFELTATVMIVAEYVNQRSDEKARRARHLQDMEEDDELDEREREYFL